MKQAQSCHWCLNTFYDDMIRDFCSDMCMNEYWKQPIKLKISTECPNCFKKYTRVIFSIEAKPYQALTICPSCDNTIFVGNNKRW